MISCMNRAMILLLIRKKIFEGKYRLPLIRRMHNIRMCQPMDHHIALVIITQHNKRSKFSERSLFLVLENSMHSHKRAWKPRTEIVKL